MNSEREELKAKLKEQLSQRLDEVMDKPTVTLSDIENVVGEFQRHVGHEVAEGLLALKKRLDKKG